MPTAQKPAKPKGLPNLTPQSPKGIVTHTPPKPKGIVTHTPAVPKEIKKLTPKKPVNLAQDTIKDTPKGSAKKEASGKAKSLAQPNNNKQAT